MMHFGMALLVRILTYLTFTEDIAMEYRRTSRFSVALTFVLATVTLMGVTARATAEQSTTPNAQAQPQERKGGNPITDGWITMKVHSQFVTEDALEDSDIDVDTNAGVVTLNGTVATDAGRTRAVAITKATDGVKSVTDKLRVAAERGTDVTGAARQAGKDAGRKITDGWITSKIYAQFLTETALDDSDIDVDVTKGAVTLTGAVRSDAGRQRAVAIAKATDGVKDVKDSLKVVTR
jgi:hyperosmotically inducible protein